MVFNQKVDIAVAHQILLMIPTYCNCKSYNQIIW